MHRRPRHRRVLPGRVALVCLLGVLMAAQPVVAAEEPIVGAMAIEPEDIDRHVTFDGSTQRAFATSPAFDIVNDFSFSAWVRHDTTCPGALEVCRVMVKERAYGVYGQGGFWKYQFHNGSSWTEVLTNVPIRAGEWTHLALTRDKATGEVVFYVDGSPRHTSTYSSAFGTSTDVVSVGGYHEGSTVLAASQPFNGDIDEVRLWNVVRTRDQLRADMHTWGPTDATGLVGYWDFNETSNATALNLATGSASASASASMSLVNRPAKTDVKSISTASSNTVVTFPRSYLTAAGGWRVPSDVTSLTYLVVAGGGGGGGPGARGNWNGGGGGGGQVRTGTLAPLGSYFAVTVGHGGAGGATAASAVNAFEGGDSALGSIVSRGGGYGGSAVANAADSGGVYTELTYGPSGTATGGGGGAQTKRQSGATGSLFSGGNGFGNTQTALNQGGGGGAGAAANGSSASTGRGGAGGAGAISTITGSSVSYGGGGGGGTGNSSGNQGAGGAGGGGAGGSSGLAGAAGSINTGGGGGGVGGGSSAGKSGGSGGSGVVIVSFSTANNTCESEQTNQGAHVVVAFKVAGTCTWPVPSGVGRVDYLVVAGGGGGGSRAGGGGGAGGYMTATDLSLSGVSNLSITVGAGGSGAAASSNSGTAGSNGANSVLTGDGSFSTVTAIGGGGGGKPQVTAPSGGSGGGASGGVSMGTSATVGSGTAGQGTNGGTGSSGTCGGTDTKWCAGGGGGAGAVGGNFVANGAAGSGGAGRAPSWLTATSAQRLGIGEVSGSAAYFAGGGGGGTNTGGTAGLGGVGGGGNGSEGHTNPGQDATAHTGGGGGGSGYAHSLGQSVGGNGGSGVVVLRYLPATTCVGVESYVENSYTVVAFKSVQTNCTWTIPAGVTTIDYLVVAGGGGGGFRHGGGGGAGGYLTATAQVVPGRSATITVGAGGTGGSSANNSGKTNGGDSQLSIDGRSVALAIGGGTEYLDGGSGGGSPYGGGAPGNGTSGQGNNGGRGASDVGAEFQCTGSTTGWCGGGGGGAGAPGENADSNNNNRAGNGGAGATTTLLSATAAQTLNVGQVSGGQVYFAGGGGGGVDIGGTAGLGGLGGGANGVAGSAVAPSAAPANTGGGGAGGGYSSTGSSGGGNGGSGVVLIRFAATTSASSIDSAAVLNGTSQYFEVAEGTEFVSRATYTVESWINPTSTACPSSSFCPFISHDGDYVLSIAENQITAYVYHTGTGFYDTWVTGVKINANEWQHVALVRDGAAARLYVNGQLRASRTLGGSTRSTYSNQFKLWFGRHYTHYFAGQIDQARVWSTARTDAQIAAAMHEHTPSTATGLVAQYDFNGVVGTTVTNTAPSAVSGTNLTAFGSPTYRDVKSTSFVGSDVVVTFPRSYLTSADGWSVPTGINNARALVLAGGGGGGSSYDNIGAGGGGAGGLIDRFTSNGVEFDSGTVRVTVGAGGFGAGPNGDGSARSQWQITGNKGQNSVLGSLVAEGGGAGGGRFASGASGGSGGGAGGRFASSTGGTATAGQGNMGGRPTSDGSQGAGGGGAGGAGGDSNGTTVGAAGAGLDLSISGQSVTYAAGGAGGQRASNVTSAPSAGANSGGGGTGGNGVGTGTVGGYGGDGGSGVVIVRYSVVPECAPVTSRTGVYVVTKFVVAGECSWNVPTGVTSLDYLVVGGGGGGGAFLASGGASAGGGGAGGVLDGSALVVSPGQSLFVTVGEGGAGGEVTSSGGSPGASGGDSSLSGTGVATITAVGGGYGAGGNVTTADYHGGPGGSGGGALGSSYLSGIGGTGVAGPPRQGYDGGTNSGGCNYRPGGGGGGAGAVGGSAICTVSVTAGGAGGAGRAISITGTSLFYGGGGGAGGHGYVNTGVDPGAGGLGGGGAGGGISGVPGIDGLGGGGGGAGYISGVNATATGGDGGRGVVIVRHVDRVITKVAGDNQTGTANSTAGVNPKVRVVDAAGNGIDGVTVSFAAGLNSGSAGSATVVTSGGGYAETTWTFGAAASHTLTATMSLVGPNSTSFAATVSSSYAVTYDANGGAGAPVQTSENIGSTVTVSSTAPTRTGYTFSSWNTVSDGSGTQYAPGATFTMPNNAVTLYAQWTLNSHNLIYDANGGSGAPSTSSANYGTTVTLAVTRPTRVGHTFTGWNTVANGSGTGYVWDGTVFTPSSFTMGDANVTLYAQWSVNSYTVTYDANGGTGAPSAQTESYNSTVTVSSSVPTRAGHTFTGWNTAVNGSGTSAASGSSFTMGDANVTLYAQWNLNTHTVTYDANGGTGAPGSATGNYGSTVNVSATRPTRTGHTFTGWNTAANGSGTGHAWSGSVFTPATFTLTADVTLFAQWSVNSYTVTYDANGGSGAPSSQSTDYNTSITVTTVVPTRAGHTFTGWNTAADGTGSDHSANTSLLVTANVTLFAKWVVQTFSISYDANGGAGAPSTASGIAFGAATSISATVPTRAGYTFSSWNTAANGSGTAYANGESVTMPANNISLFAQWTATIQTVTYDANGGSGAPSDDTVATDATVTVSSSVPTRDGYTFLRWNTAANGSGVDRSSGSTFTMGPTNVTLYAIWLANTYSITYDANGGMSPPASSNAQTDSTVTVPGTTPTRAGYTFSSWNTARNGSGAHLLPGATFTMPAGATTLFAQWSANANNLVYNANGGTGGPATIVATTDSSVTVSGSIPTRAGYTFSSWNSAVDGSGMTYAAGTTFTMPTTHLTLFAQWTVSTFQVLYDANGGSGAPAATNGTFQSVVNLTSVAPTRSGYTFLGWGTVADGSGTNHAAGGAFVVPARNTTLYAVWVADVNDVYYVVNGGLGGPDASVAATGTAVPLPSIRPTREGHSFVGWNTAANGTGTGYTWNGSAFTPASFTMPGSDVFLFAQWSVNSYTVTYDANGGSGTVPAAQTDQFRASITLAASSLTRSGWSFVGWNTAADGTGVQWATGATYGIGSSNVTLYAEWNRNVNALIFDPLGGSSAPDVRFGATGTNVILPTSVPVREGHTFLGWEDSNQTALSPGDPYTMPVTSVTLFARWSINSYALTYDVNGGIGSVPSAQNIEYASSVTVSGSIPTRAGYTFSSWNSAVDGSGTAYASGATFSMPAGSLTLFAQWTEAPVPTTTTVPTTVTPTANEGSPAARTPKPVEQPNSSGGGQSVNDTTTTTTPPADESDVDEPVVDESDVDEPAEPTSGNEDQSGWLWILMTGLVLLAGASWFVRSRRVK